MVPIPEGVERSDEEPANESYALAAQSDGGGSSSSSTLQGVGASWTGGMAGVGR